MVRKMNHETHEMHEMISYGSSLVGLPCWIGGVAAASVEGVVVNKNQIFQNYHPALAKPRTPPKQGGEFLIPTPIR